jgi:hypothetical protein
MPEMTLMQILVACENQLGWIPKGNDQYKARAVMHSIVKREMTRKGHTLGDLALTLAYCRLKRHPITSPLELLGLIPKARDAAAVVNKPHALDVRTQMARDWEAARDDDDSPYWLGRLVRSVGPARADTLDEWAQAGRGT